MHKQQLNPRFSTINIACYIHVSFLIFTQISFLANLGFYLKKINLMERRNNNTPKIFLRISLGKLTPNREPK